MLTIRFADSARKVVDVKRSHLKCINPQGTEYRKPLHKIDRYFAASPEHVVKTAAWLKHLLKVIEKGYLRR